MSDRLDELGPDTVVVLVTFTNAENISPYQHRNTLAFPILLDPTRQGYRDYALELGSLRQVWGLRTLWRYIELLRDQGRSALQSPVEDTRQLGGDFIIDPDGDLIYAFWSRGPADRPSVDELVAAVNDRSA